MGCDATKDNKAIQCALPSPKPRKNSVKTPVQTITPSSFPSTPDPIEPIDFSSIDRIADGADFAELANAKISLQAGVKKIEVEHVQIKDSKHKQEFKNSDWNEKYYIHGTSSDIVADITNETRGCIKSSESVEIDRTIATLHEIDVEAEFILKEQLSAISAKQQIYIDQFIQEREVLIEKVVVSGSLQINNYEIYYRTLIEDFIKKLETEMSTRLDALQYSIEFNKESILKRSYQNIERVTITADSARNAFYQRLQQSIIIKRKEIMDQIDSIKWKKELSSEQLRTLTLKIYSTAGNQVDGQGCENIHDREKFIKDIHDAKPHQPIKRTVYLGNDLIKH